MEELDPSQIPNVVVFPFKEELGSRLWGIWDLKKSQQTLKKPRVKALQCRLFRSYSAGILPVPAALRDGSLECGKRLGRREWEFLNLGQQNSLGSSFSTPILVGLG